MMAGERPSDLEQSQTMPINFLQYSGHVVYQFHCWGILLIWIKVRQRSSVLAVGADGVVWASFLSSIIFFLSPSLWKTA